MSTASEQRAWGRGNRPASISRAPVPQSRSSVSSPTTAGPPSPALPKQTESKPLATVKPAEQAKTTPAPAPAGNIWEQRRQAQQQARTATPATSKDGAKSTVEPTKKNEANAAASTAGAKDDGYTPVNGFNANVVREFLGRDASRFQAYKVGENGSKSTTSGSRGTMANGQMFFSLLSKQIAQLQGNK